MPASSLLRPDCIRWQHPASASPPSSYRPSNARNTDLAVVDIIEIVQIFDAVIHSVRRQQRIGVAGVFVIAVSFTVDCQNDKSAPCKLDRILKLHFAVVQISVRQNDCRQGIVGTCFIGLEQNSADDFPFDLNGFARSNNLTSFVFGIAQIGNFHLSAVGLNCRADQAADQNNDKTYRQKYNRNFIFNKIF